MIVGCWFPHYSYTFINNGSGCTLAFKMNYFMLMGVIRRLVTPIPRIRRIRNQTAGNNAPAVGYSTVYPVSMFLRILTAQLLILILAS